MIPLLMLTYDPADPREMQRPPRQKGALLDKTRIYTVLVSGIMRGALATAVCLMVFHNLKGKPGAWETGLTSTFVTIVLTQFVSIFYLRTNENIFSRYTFSNPRLFLGILISLVAMLAIIYIPQLNLFLHTQPLAWPEFRWIFAALGVFVVFSSLWRYLMVQKIPGQA